MSQALSLSAAPRLRKAMPTIVGVAIVVAALWWLLSLDRVSERVRNEEVEMIDLAVPPPPPPPPPEEVVAEVQPEQATEQLQAVQPDPLSPPQPTSTNPPAGDLSSLLQDPTAASGSFSGGARGQGGTRTGPLIGGTGRGSTASRAYAERVMLHVRRHLQRDASLKGKPYKFRLRVSVSPGGAVTVASVRNVSPGDLEGPVSGALRGLPGMDAPPPEGLPNFINIDINQT